MSAIETLQRVQDDVLLERVRQLAKQEREVTADLLGCLGEIDARRLYQPQGCPSMRAYCVEVLKYVDGSAYRRIRAARIARRFPQLLEMLRTGEIHVSGIVLLSPVLDENNAPAVIRAARYKSKRAIERLVRLFCPVPPIPGSNRRIPETVLSAAPPPGVGPGMGNPAEPGAQAIASIESEEDELRTERDPGRECSEAPWKDGPQWCAEARHPITFVASAATMAKLERAVELCRDSIPDGSLDAIFSAALDALIERMSHGRGGAGQPPPPVVPQRWDLGAARIRDAARRAASARGGLTTVRRTGEARVRSAPASLPAGGRGGWCPRGHERQRECEKYEDAGSRRVEGLRLGWRMSRRDRRQRSPTNEDDDDEGARRSWERDDARLTCG